VGTVVGTIMTAHVPAIGTAIAQGAQQEPYWKAFFEQYHRVHQWLDDVRPDVAIVLYNDHGLNFFLDKMPTFAVGAAPEYRYADEGWGLPGMFPVFPGDPALSWHLIESLVANDFDITTCQEMLVDHAFAIPMALMWPNVAAWPVRTVPICINTVQHPLPSAKRCFNLGRCVGRAVEAYADDLKVVVIGTGGLSHQLDGTRAGFINKPFDLMCMEKIVEEPEALTHLTNVELIEQAGSQGVELLMWMAARGTLGGQVAKVHGNYHIPISNTAAGLLVLENASRASAQSEDAAELSRLSVPR
jgi:protocatechuate 4,5-dioxygenase beta chain